MAYDVDFSVGFAALMTPRAAGSTPAAGSGAEPERAAPRLPYQWQRRLHDRFLAGDCPGSLDLPTGLGKTAVIAIWLLALAAGAPVPRRLVYVVDRRAIVDQATDVAAGIGERLKDGVDPAIAAIRRGLGFGAADQLTVSTLRGGLAGDRRWAEEPGRPAILVGTVDMIGSRLLFRDYGIGRKMRAVHAGLLAHDTLIVLDEAHLCPPFEALVRQVRKRVAKVPAEKAAVLPPPLTLLALTATARRPTDAPFGLTDEDFQDPPVRDRITAPKPLTIVTDAEGKSPLDGLLTETAWRLAEEGRAQKRILIYCDRRETARKVHDALEKRLKAARKEGLDGRACLMTGERRVMEREELATADVFRWFRDGDRPDWTGPGFLTATSAGEVGVDLDADAMVGDVVAWERMVQRFGRVNRRGSSTPAPMVVLAAPEAKEKPDVPKKRDRVVSALALLPTLPDGGLDASIAGFLTLKARLQGDPAVEGLITAASTPVTSYPALSPLLKAGLSMTGIDDKAHKGRPARIDPWLRGWDCMEEEPETKVAWRRSMPWPQADMTADKVMPPYVETFFEAAPIRLLEELEAPVWRVVEVLRARLSRWLKGGGDGNGSGPLVQGCAILLDGSGKPIQRWRAAVMAEMLETPRRRSAFEQLLPGSTLVLHAALGGIDKEGLLSAEDPAVEVRTLDMDPGHVDDMRRRAGFRVYRVAKDAADVAAVDRKALFRLPLSGEGETGGLLVVEDVPDLGTGRADRAQAKRAQSLEEHVSWVREAIARMSAEVGLDPAFQAMLDEAARLHDEGKRRRMWQRAMGNKQPSNPMAKFDRRGDPDLLAGYRHEFGSLLAALEDPALMALPDDLRALALHLIASHHGHARPGIRAVLPPPDKPARGEARELDLPPALLRPFAQDVERRMARLEAEWGPWGLAWWEALFRSADAAASRRNDEHGGRKNGAGSAAGSVDAEEAA